MPDTFPGSAAAGYANPPYAGLVDEDQLDPLVEIVSIYT